MAGTFSYSGNPASSDRDAIRFLVGDTDTTEPLIWDEEIDFLITTWLNKNSVYWTASTVAEAIAARFAREITTSADGESLGASELQQKYLDLASRLRVLHQTLLTGGNVDAGGVNAGEQVDPSVVPLAFGTGMHDSVEAGQQDYGDWPGIARIPEIFGSW
jgi:hypothetical protein